MRQRKLTRDKAIEEYLIYRRRIREFLDMAQMRKDIEEHKYEPRDLLGRGPGRFAELVSDCLMGLFASLMDRQADALNVFDVWVVLFSKKRDKIEGTWKKIEPHVELIREYRNNVVAHASKNLRRHVETRSRFDQRRHGIIKGMHQFLPLAAELMRDEATALPDLRAEADPILRKLFPNQRDRWIQQLADYCLAAGENAEGERSA
jgi:uncharacterized protein YaaR (DUF327 family)